jgi:hypothetical protein
MNDEGRPPRRPRQPHLGPECSSGLGVVCVCGVRQATTKRRTPRYVGTWNLPEPVCGPCAVELDELRERIARGVVRVDVVVQKFRGNGAA